MEIRTESSVDEILTSDGDKVRGVKLSDGTIIDAPIVISNATHHVTFNNLVKNQNHIPEDFKRGLQNISYEGSACKINLVLNDIP